MNAHDLELLAQATKAAMESGARSRSQTVMIPGQAQDFDPETGLVAVRLDGDTTTVQGVPNLSSSWPYLGERVMCMFVPPQGLFVTAVLKNVGPPHWEGTGSGTALSAAVTAPLNIDVGTGGRFEYFEIVLGPTTGQAAIVTHLNGWHKITARVVFPSAVAGRRFMGFAINEVAAAPGGVVDTQTGGTGPFIASASANVKLVAEDIVQVRALSTTAMTVTVDEFSIEWTDRPSIWEG